SKPQGESSSPGVSFSLGPLLRASEDCLKVSLMITCLGDALFPEVGVATVKLLRRLGVEVDFPPAQTCCGQPHFNSGFHNDARDLARHTIQAFANGQK